MGGVRIRNSFFSLAAEFIPSAKIALFAFLLFFPSLAHALPCPASPTDPNCNWLVNNGSPERRFNVVFLGDGFTAGEQDLYNNKVAEIVNWMQGSADVFGEAPQRGAINFYRINYTSRESDHPGVCSDTYSGSLTTEVEEGLLSRLVPNYDRAITIVNDLAPDADPPGAGGCAGGAFVAIGIPEPGGPNGEVHPMSTLAHELGHTFDLGHEFEFGGGTYDGYSLSPNCFYTPNAATVDRRTISWGDLISPSTPLPTPDGTPSDPVGLRYGCDHYSDVFHAQQMCYMGARLVINSFCQVCRRIITNVLLPYLNNPPVAVAGADQTVVANVTVRLSGSASADPDHDPLTYRWRLASKNPTNAPNVTLRSANTATPTFTAPSSTVQLQYTFELIVNDDCGSASSPRGGCDRQEQGDSAPALVTVTIYADTSRDSDGDGLPDTREAALGTNPNNRDTDGDGLSDGDEVNRIGSDPLSRDTDRDGYADDRDANPLVAKGSLYDFTGDRKSDAGFYSVSTGELLVAHANGGNFETPAEGWSGPWYPPDRFELVTGDFNGDGVADVAYHDISQNSSRGNISVGLSVGNRFRAVDLWLDGGSFDFAQDVRLVVGDFNGDGASDIAFADGTVQVAYANPSQEIFEAPEDIGVAGGCASALVGNFNGDKADDLLCRNNGTPSVWLNNGGSFDVTAVVSYMNSNYVSFVGDFNGDRLEDVGFRDVSDNSSNGTVMIALSDGRRFGTPVRWADGRYNARDHRMVVGDFNGDGKSDLGYRRVTDESGEMVVCMAGRGQFYPPERVWLPGGEIPSDLYVLIGAREVTLVDAGIAPGSGQGAASSAPTVTSTYSAVSPRVYTFAVANPAGNAVSFNRFMISGKGVTRIADPAGWTHTLVPNAGGFVTIIYETASAPMTAGQTLSFGYTASGSPAPVDWVANDSAGTVRFTGRVTGAGI